MTSSVIRFMLRKTSKLGSDGCQTSEHFRPFDGRAFDRDASILLLDLAQKLPRSPFRDQYSIYLSIWALGRLCGGGSLGLPHLRNRTDFPCRREPDVAAFCRLQLALYQRPDGRGQNLSWKWSCRTRECCETLELIGDGYHICPLRLILRIF